MTARNLQTQPDLTIQPGLTKHQVAKFRRQGYLVVRNVFMRSEIDELEQSFANLQSMAAAKKEDFFVKGCYFNLFRQCDPFAKDVKEHQPVEGMLRRVTYPYLVDTLLDRYRSHPHILQVMGSLLGGDVVQLVNQVNFNPAGIGTGWGWHQDYRFRRKGVANMEENVIQMLIAIDSCCFANGGLRVLPGSHQWGNLTLDDPASKDHERIDASKAVTPSLEPGDAIIFTPYTVHGSTPNTSTFSRRVFINGYCRMSACEHGLPVMKGFSRVVSADGIMEYEGNQELLPLAAKYS